MKNDSQQRRSIILNINKLIHHFYEFHQNFKFKPLHNIINICDIIRLKFYLINLMKTMRNLLLNFQIHLFINKNVIIVSHTYLLYDENLIKTKNFKYL